MWFFSFSYYATISKHKSYKIMKMSTGFQKLTTICGKVFEKNLLEVISFQSLNFTETNTTFTIYKSQLNEYIRCKNSYDAIRDYISIECDIISEKVALQYVNR